MTEIGMSFTGKAKILWFLLAAERRNPFLRLRCGFGYKSVRLVFEPSGATEMYLCRCGTARLARLYRERARQLPTTTYVI